MAALSLIMGGLAVTAVGRRMATARLGSNRLAGPRIRPTLSSEAARHAGQQAAAPGTLAAGLTMLFGGAALLPTGMEPSPVSIVILLVSLILLGAFLVASVVAGRRAAEEATGDPGNAKRSR